MKKFLMLALCLVLALMPAMALAAPTAKVEISITPEALASNLAVNASGATVYGLDQLLAGLSDTGDSDEEASLVMSIRQMTSANASEDVLGDYVVNAIKQLPETAGATIEFMDFTVYLNDGEWWELPSVLEIVVPFDFAGREDLGVHRYHSNTSEINSFTRLSAKPATPVDSTFFADTANNRIHIYTNKFSIYAVSYKGNASAGTNPGSGSGTGSNAGAGSNSGTGSNAGTGSTTASTGTASVPKTGDSSTPVLWAMLLALSAAGIVTATRKKRA